jgi:hypothetical protein
VDLQEIARAFRGIISYDELTVRVHTPQRDYAKRCSAQEALNALFGLVMATSGCPRLAPLRGLARYHP